MRLAKKSPFIRICTRYEKYSSKLDISRSFIRIFADLVYNYSDKHI